MLSRTRESRSVRAKSTTNLSTRYIHLTVFTPEVKNSAEHLNNYHRRSQGEKTNPTNFTELISIILHSTPF